MALRKGQMRLHFTLTLFQQRPHIPQPPGPTGQGAGASVIEGFERVMVAQADEAHNGAQALALYSNRGVEICLVITDLDMPHLGGCATVDALLSMNPDLKIVVATGLDFPPEGGATVPAGCRAWLKKPCETGLLLQTVDLVLRGKCPSPEQVL